MRIIRLYDNFSVNADSRKSINPVEHNLSSATMICLVNTELLWIS